LVTDTTAHWVATCTSAQTGRKVDDDVRSGFSFTDGLIATQVDGFFAARSSEG
jgi:hypothetical protein